MKNSYFKKIFDKDSIGVSDEQLLDKIQFLNKIKDLDLWVSEIKNPNITNDEAKIIALSFNGTSWKVPLSYLKRDDTGIIDAFDIVKKVKHYGFWKMISGLLITKSKLFLANKEPEEKLKAAQKINSIFFWKIVLKEENVKKLIFSLSAEQAISYSETIGCTGVWNLIFQNPNVIESMNA